ncbi:fructose-bisphosphate aldolase [Gordonia sp. HY002]|uniref:glycoside hydrolase family 76 protein n=1 Tax=Gordonia zhenghanii TaxID=2911516 RepID=UPI001F373749|nr:glycoside hydrolase family 76 protein [Gordonia zhenghanii]MCF8570105.1 fructose-bisphosphate aldolase [Gordonia zhenghanii]
MSPEVESAQRRAAAAQSALRARHLRPIGGWVPFTRIGRVAWPPAGRPLSKERLTASWNYWWQAHLVDVLVDGAIHRGDEQCARDATALLRGIRIRNVGRWTNSYYDDMAWLGLAVERTERRLGSGGPSCRPRALRVLRDRMVDAWSPESGGGIPWRTTDTFFNAPANGPAAILLSRTDRVERAVAMADWIDDNLCLPSGLIADGVWRRSDGSRDLDDALFTYCQGVALGAYTEAYRHTGDRRRLDRIDALLTATAARFTTDGVVRGAGGGDGGLFGGVLTRNLALVATDLPGQDETAESVRSRAAAIVTASADAAWANRTEHDGLPVFGPDWRKPAVVPTSAGPSARKHGGAVASSKTPERDLSVQIGATMLLEAAVAVTIRSPEHIGSTPD